MTNFPFYQKSLSDALGHVLKLASIAEAMPGGTPFSPEIARIRKPLRSEEWQALLVAYRRWIEHTKPSEEESLESTGFLFSSIAEKLADVPVEPRPPRDPNWELFDASLALSVQAADIATLAREATAMHRAEDPPPAPPPAPKALPPPAPVPEAPPAPPPGADRKPSLPKEKTDKGASGRELALEEIVPYHSPVPGAKALDRVALAIRRHLVADPTSVDALALWACLAHLADSPGLNVLPLLVIHSPTRQCGKSTALTMVEWLTPRALSASSITAAAMFRTVEKYRPTLLIDEADSVFRSNEDLRTLVNSGFTRGQARAIRCSGDSQEPRLFSTWCPKAIALIGRLPDTLESRSVIIPLRRKGEHEVAEPLRLDQKGDFPLLASVLARWTADHMERIAAREPELPPGLNDRQRDLWRELLRIADEAGGTWPERAREAARTICGRQAAEGDEDVKTTLLRDLRDYFESDNRPVVPSKDVVDYLVDLEGSPWPEYRDGKPVTATGIARILKSFGIRTEKARASPGAAPTACYKPQDFRDAFARYLTPPAPPTEPEHGTNGEYLIAQ